MLALIGVLEKEISDIKKSMVVENIDTRGGIHVYRGSYKGKDVLLVKSGVGKQRALVACRSILDHYPVTAIVSFGFGGALKSGNKSGDIFICTSMVYADKSHRTRYDPDVKLLALAQTCKLDRLRSGIGVTSDNVVISPREKCLLRDSSTADVVDMESYWIAKFARENGIPFIACRAVSDTLKDTVPVPSQRWRKAIVFQHPLQVWTLRRGMRKARESLTAFAAHMVEATG